MVTTISPGVCFKLTPVALALALLCFKPVRADDISSRYANDPFVEPTSITPLTLPDAWPTNLPRDPQNRSAEGASTKLVVLGTGMPLPNPYRSGPGYAVVVNGQPYLVDAGEGIWRSVARAALVNGDEFVEALAPNKLKYLFITHLHADHTVGIPSLLLNPFKLNIPTSKQIYGPVGIADMVSHIREAWAIDIAAELSDGYDPEGARAVGHEIDVDTSAVVFADANVTVRAYRTIHGPLENTFAYRFETESRTMVFTGDGGPYHENFVAAAKEADILVAEAVTEANIEYAPWGGDTIEEKKKEIFRYHFSPEVLARIANEAGVEAIDLSHEQNYNNGRDYDPLGIVKEIRAAGFDGAIYSAMDADVY